MGCWSNGGCWWDTIEVLVVFKMAECWWGVGVMAGVDRILLKF